MTQNQQPVTPVQETALQRLMFWRQCDKAAIAAKQDRDAQRAEWSQRVKLRDAADQLGEAQP